MLSLVTEVDSCVCAPQRWGPMIVISDRLMPLLKQLVEAVATYVRGRCWLG